MIEVQLKTTDGKSTVSVNLPETVDEIKLRHFTEFEKAHERKEKVFTQLQSGDKPFAAWRLDYIQAILDCVKAMNLGDLDNVAFGEMVEYLTSEDENTLDFEQTEASVMKIHAHFYNVIAQYDGIARKAQWQDDYTFTYKGQDYVIKGGYMDAISGQPRFYQHSTAQVVESLEILRHYEKHKDQDPKGNYLFTSILYVMACFALKPGEEFPDNDLEIDRFINERVKLFQDVPLTVGLDVLNFFLHTGNSLNNRQSSNTSGIHLKA